MKNNICFFVDYQLSPHVENNVTNKNNEGKNDFAPSVILLEIKLQITVLVMPHLRLDQILAVLRNIEEDVSEYDDSGSESDALYRFELNYEIMITFTSITSVLDSSECTRKRPQIEEGQVEATLPNQESYTAAASTDTSQAE